MKHFWLIEFTNAAKTDWIPWNLHAYRTKADAERDARNHLPRIRYHAVKYVRAGK